MDMDMDSGTEATREQIAEEGTGLDGHNDDDENVSGAAETPLRDNNNNNISSSMHRPTTTADSSSSLLTIEPQQQQQQGGVSSGSLAEAAAEEAFMSEFVNWDGLESGTGDTTRVDTVAGGITNTVPIGDDALDTPAQETAEHHDANPSDSQGQNVIASVKNWSISVRQEASPPAAAGGHLVTPPPSDPDLYPALPSLDSDSETESKSSAEEPSERSDDVTEHPAEEEEESPNDMSYTTESVVEIVKEKPPVETKPFDFLGCEDEVRQRILHFVLVSPLPMIKPYFNFGSVEVAAHHCCKPNYAPVVAALAGNKDLVEQATAILYGENAFYFDHSRIALWWVKRVGRDNVNRLRHLVIKVDQGSQDFFGSRIESIWRRFFDHLFPLPPPPPPAPHPPLPADEDCESLSPQQQHHHSHLHTLSISFEKWTFERDECDNLGGGDRLVSEPRNTILRTLFAVRGLEGAVVVPGIFVTAWYACTLQRAMCMGVGQTDDGVRACVSGLGLPVVVREGVGKGVERKGG